MAWTEEHLSIQSLGSSNPYYEWRGSSINFKHTVRPMKYHPNQINPESSKPFEVTVVREAGVSPASGEFVGRAEETLKIMAATEQDAYKESLLRSRIKFCGQQRRTFINGLEHFDERI